MGLSSPYSTPLNPIQEQQFQQWVVSNRIPWQDTLRADYDMRGYWKAQQSGDPNATQAANQHFPDTYKTPYHATISNESQYAPPGAPAWNGDKLMTPAGRVVADETSTLGSTLNIGQPVPPVTRTDATMLTLAQRLRGKNGPK